jgi:hypothetical protein
VHIKRITSCSTVAAIALDMKDKDLAAAAPRLEFALDCVDKHLSPAFKAEHLVPTLSRVVYLRGFQVSEGASSCAFVSTQLSPCSSNAGRSGCANRSC